MNIGIFFSYNTSLKHWQSAGILERELQPFKKLHVEAGHTFTLFTYGGEGDYKIMSEKLLIDSGINCIAFHENINPIMYVYTLVKKLIKLDLFFSLQSSGLISALPLSIIFRKPLISRSGFDLIEFSKSTGNRKVKILIYRILETISVITSRKHIFATQLDLKNYAKRNKWIKDIIKHYKCFNSKDYILPNWVDTDVFIMNKLRSKIIYKDKITLLSIGRLENQKNYVSFINEIKELGSEIRLNIIGEGKNRSDISDLCKSYNINLNLIERMENSLLPRYINSSDIYFQSSIIEGHPKALLEAMSCGAIVLCRNSPGMNNIIVHKHNGFLYTDGNVTKVLEEILVYNNLSQISKNARKTITENYSLENYLIKLSKCLITNSL